MRKLVFIAMLLFCLDKSFSQEDYSDGYILKGNDTIKGKVKDKARKTDAMTIKFIDPNGKKFKYTPKNIKGYGKTGEGDFRIVETGIFGGMWRFARVAADGYVVLYVSRFKSQGSLMAFEYPYVGLKSEPLKTTLVSEVSFRASMAQYFYDDPEVKQLMEDKILRAKDIKQIVEKYNENKSKKQ